MAPGRSGGEARPLQALKPGRFLRGVDRACRARELDDRRDLADRPRHRCRAHSRSWRPYIVSDALAVIGRHRDRPQPGLDGQSRQLVSQIVGRLGDVQAWFRP